MAIKNLVGFVKMAIIGNPNVDKDTATTLCEYVHDIKVCLDNQDSLVNALQIEISRLRELNKNQAKIIANYLPY